MREPRPTLPPFNGFPDTCSPRCWTKPFQGSRQLTRVFHDETATLENRVPRDVWLRRVAVLYHDAWLDSRALEENTERNAPIPPRGLKISRLVETIPSESLS